MSTIITYTCKHIDVFKPNWVLVDIEDIANALAKSCRFNGHVNVWHYSVAEHSYLVSLFAPPGLELECLLHDAAEAYLPDMPSPIKHTQEFTFYRSLEYKWEEAIAEKFFIEFPYPDIVKELDMRILLTEQEQLRGLKPNPAICGLDPLPVKIQGWDAETAYKVFMARFNELWELEA